MRSALVQPVARFCPRRPRLPWYHHGHSHCKTQMSYGGLRAVIRQLPKPEPMVIPAGIRSRPSAAAVYERLRKMAADAAVSGVQVPAPEPIAPPAPPHVSPAVDAVSGRLSKLAASAAFWHNHCFRLGSGVREPGTLGEILSQGTKTLFIEPGCKFQKPYFIEKPPDEGFQLEKLMVDTIALDAGLHLLLKSCRNLKEVRLRASMMTASILSGLLRNENLEKIDLRMFRGCSFNHLMAIIRNSRRMTHWRSEGVSPLTPKQLTAFVCELPDTMRDIALAPDFKYLCDEHLDLLVRACPRLQRLYLHNCAGLTEAALSHVCTLPELEMLDVTACPGIRVGALAQMKSITTLRTLRVNGQPLGSEEIVELRKELPNVDISQVDAS